MSSMPSQFLASPKAFATVILMTALAAATPSSAQLTNESGPSSAMVAQQPRGIEAAISRWEYLQKTRGLSFADYAGFAKAYPEFPRMATLQFRAEAALEEEAPPTADLIAFFDAFEPQTNSARARYALALAGQQDPRSFDVAREAWRSGSMSGPAEVYILGLFGSRLTDEDHVARMDALLWQRDAEGAVRQLIRIPDSERPMAQARLALVNGERPENAGVDVPAGAELDPGYVYNLATMLRDRRDTFGAVRVLSGRQEFARSAFNPEDMVRLKLAVAKTASASDAVQIAASVDDLFAPGFDVSTGSFGLRDKYTDLMEGQRRQSISTRSIITRSGVKK